MASRSLNRAILIGNLTRDPELKYTPSGTAVCTFGVATNRSWTTAEGETKEDVQFHRIVAWQKLAELCSKLLSKGRKVYLEGRITYRSFTGKDGQERQVTEIILDDFVVFDDRRKMADQESSPKAEESDAPHTGIESVDEPVTAKETKKTDDETISEDDIPF